MAFAELWLPIIGAGILGSWAIGAWYGGNKVLAIWLGFGGAVFLLLLLALQVQQHFVMDDDRSESPGRPWVAVEGIAKVEFLFFTRDFMPSISLDLAVRVHGERPAQKVAAWGWLIPNGIGPDLLLLQKQWCEEIIKAPPTLRAVRGSLTLFPGVTNQTVIVAATARSTSAFAEQHRKGATKIAPTLVGCVLYYDRDDVPHWTGFIFRILRRDPNDSRGALIDFGADSVIPGTELLFTPLAIGGGPAT